MKDLLSKFKKDPLGFIKRALYKIVIGPLKYNKGNDYDAANYWRDRFEKHGQTLKGAGDEGLSEEENKEHYEKAAKVFTSFCMKEGIDFKNSDVLEIGVGTGFYTRLLHDLGVRKYTGVDITDVFFSKHKNNFPQFKFVKKDITVDKLEGKYDLIVMIDVIEHIVNEKKFASAMENVRNSLSDDGIFVVAPVMDEDKKHLFYLSSHSLQDIKNKFPGYRFSEPMPFRDGNIIGIKKYT